MYVKNSRKWQEDINGVEIAMGSCIVWEVVKSLFIIDYIIIIVIIKINSIIINQGSILQSLG